MLFSARRVRSVSRIPSGLPYVWQRYGKYAVAYACIVLALAFVPFWKSADLALFSVAVGLADDRGADHVVAVDLGAPQQLVRKKLSDTLTTLVKDPARLPNAVVIDIALTVPKGAPDGLRAAIEALRAHNVDVFGAVAPPDQPDSGPQSAPLDYDLYADARVFTTLGHAVLKAAVTSMTGDRVVGYYPSQLPIPFGDTAGAAHTPMPVTSFPALSLAIENADSTSVVPNTSDEFFWTGQRTALKMVDATRASDLGKSDLYKKVVVIGNPKTESGTKYGRSYLELLSWAIDDRFVATKPFFNGPIVWLVTTLFSSLAVLVFLGVWRLLKTQAFALPLTCAVACALAFLLLMFMDVLLFKLHWLYTELTLAVVGIVTGIGVAFVWSLETIRHERFLVALRSAAKVVERFDVFISYARTPENSAWVEEHLVAPLRQAKCADGRPLRVFFDRESIATGMDWYQRLVDGIEGSRYFIPVYSDGYFNRYYCRDEIELALLRLTQRSDFIQPLSRMAKPPPRKYREIQYLDVRRTPSFVDTLVRTIAGTEAHAATIAS